MFRKSRFILILLVICLSAGVVSAREILSQAECVVPAETVIDGTLYVACETLEIDGTVNGDVIGGAVRSTIRGTVDGNVYLFSGQLNISGTVVEDVHFGGGVLRVAVPNIAEVDNAQTDDEERTLPPRIEGSIKAISLSAEIGNRTSVIGGIINLGYQLIIDGLVENEINFWGSLLEIDGVVLGDVFASVGNPASESSTLEALLLPLSFDLELLNPGLVISEGTWISGSLNYRGPQTGQIEGTIMQEIVFYPMLSNPLPTLEEPRSFARYASQFGREFITLLLIGAVAIFLAPTLINLPLTNLRMRPFANFSVGMLAFILSFPVLLIGLFLSLVILFVLQLIGLQALVVAVAIVLGLINFSGMSLFYFVAIFVARALVGLAVGRLLLRILFGRRDYARWVEYVALALGVLVLSIVFSLPVIGWLFNAAALFLGLGSILTMLLDQFRRIRDTASVPVPFGYTPSPVVTRPRAVLGDVPHIDIQPVERSEDEPPPRRALPPSDEPSPTPMPPGMENLPEGFDISFFDDETDD